MPDVRHNIEHLLASLWPGYVHRRDAVPLAPATVPTDQSGSDMPAMQSRKQAFLYWIQAGTDSSPDPALSLQRTAMRTIYAAGTGEITRQEARDIVNIHDRPMLWPRTRLDYDDFIGTGVEEGVRNSPRSTAALRRIWQQIARTMSSTATTTDQHRHIRAPAAPGTCLKLTRYYNRDAWDLKVRFPTGELVLCDPSAVKTSDDGTETVEIDLSGLPVILPSTMRSSGPGSGADGGSSLRISSQDLAPRILTEDQPEPDLSAFPTWTLDTVS